MNSPQDEEARPAGPAPGDTWIPLGLAAAWVIAETIALAETVRIADRFVAGLDLPPADSPSTRSAGPAS